jgi:rhamnosyltransferase
MVKVAAAPTWKVIVLTLNAAADWPHFAPMLLASVQPGQVIVIDSDSTDGTAALARAAAFEVRSIARRDFNHGATRQLAAEMFPDAEILVYLTQDAVLARPDAVVTLLAAFQDLRVSAAYGRQLPRPEAGAIEAHARSFNYPANSDVHDLASRERLGLKAIFISNSFAAYRRSALLEIGGFRRDVIFGEDTLAAADLLLSGHKVAYIADACVYHSHDYTWRQEFRRYFDIGVLHSRERRTLGEFGRPTGEGRRFVVSEMKYLGKRNLRKIPSALARTGFKLLGYRLGKIEARLGPAMKQRLSMQPSFWTKKNSVSPNDLQRSST